jgi:AraC-like DNA-binding protein
MRELYETYIAKTLRLHQVKFSVVLYNKNLLDEKFKHSTVNYLVSKGYKISSTNDLHHVVILTNNVLDLVVVVNDQTDFDLIISSKEKLAGYIEAIVNKDISEYYKYMLEKFRNTELYTCIEMALYQPETNYKIADLAEKSHMTSRNFTRLFKKISGISFLEFYRPFKIGLAKDMIRRGLEINEIIDRLGFKDNAYFSRIFKEITGMTPGHYRKIAKGK